MPAGLGTKSEVPPILMNGRAWRIEVVDWERFQVLVSPAHDRGDARWQSGAVALSFDLMQAQREVLLGMTPDVHLSQRAINRLAAVREARATEVDADRLVVERRGSDLHFWTWAGLKANETLRAALGAPEGGSDNDRMVLRDTDGLKGLQQTDFAAVVPRVYPEMAEALKFSAALPSALAIRTLGERLAGREAAAKVAAMPRLRRHGELSL